MKNPFLIGKKIYLRPLELSDLEKITAFRNNQASRDYFAEDILYPSTHLENEQFIKDFTQNKSSVVLAITIRENDKLIGYAGLTKISRVSQNAEYFIFIGDETEWNKGYASEVTRLIVEYGFETINLHKVWLAVFEENVAGKKVYQKAGFSEEGFLRESAFRNGKFHNIILMGILKEEYKKIKASGRF